MNPGRRPPIGQLGPDTNLAGRHEIYRLVIVMALLLLGVGWTAAQRYPIALDTDEGINLAKATLIADGYRLHRDIWSDQPGGFAYLLVGWRGVVGSSIEAARMLPLLLSATALLAIGWLVSQLTGPRSGTLTVLLILCTHRYIRLSTSVMIGLPALCVAIAALVPLVLVRRQTSFWLKLSLIAASGVLFGLALQIKLWVMALIPLVMVLCAISRPGLRRLGRVGLIALWVATCSACFVCAGLAMGGFSSLLVTPHLAGSLPYISRWAANGISLATFLVQDLPVTMLAIVGLVSAYARRDRRCMLGVVTLISALAFLLNASPSWHHHRTLVAIPLATIAAIGMGELWDRAKQAHRRLPVWRSLIVVAIALVIGYRIWDGWGVSLWRERDRLNPSVLAVLEQHVAAAPLVLTDDPIYCEYVGLKVMPYYAAMTAKRLLRGEMDYERMLDDLRQQKPSIVLLGRFQKSWPVNAMKYLQDHYVQVFDDSSHTVYVIRSSADGGATSATP